MAFERREPLQKPLEKIELTVGFGNLMGEAAAAWAEHDYREISKLFARTNAPKQGETPRTPILFLYARLTPDGYIDGMAGGAQKLVALTKSKLLVLAAENPSQHIIKAGTLREEQYANIIFTNNRKGNGFANFFVAMFGYMMISGAGIRAVYNNVASERVKPKPWLPGTIFDMAVEDMKLPKGERLL